MMEQKDKTPEQVSDEDYKIAPTSADKEYLEKDVTTKAVMKAEATCENYLFPSTKKIEESSKE